MHPIEPYLKKKFSEEHYIGLPPNLQNTKFAQF